LFLQCGFKSFAQDTRETDAYKTETEGYFTNPAVTIQGIVLSDNHASKLYLIRNNKRSELVSAPGCGRYFTVSPDKAMVGFKLIKPDGLQVPAIIDLRTMKVSELAPPADLCGQVSFGNDGRMAFTIGKDLQIIHKGNVAIIPLGTYANIAPISPDGSYAVFNNDHDQLFLINISSGHVQQITDNAGGYMYPQWSPDGNKVVYSSLSGTLKIWDKNSGKTVVFGSGQNAVWSDDSQYVLYNVISSENLVFKGSDIYMARVDDSAVIRITQTSGINEMYPCFGPDNKIIYSTYDNREIVSTTVNKEHAAILHPEVIYKSAAPLFIDKGEPVFSQKNNKSVIMVQGDVPYVHQVYDTPDWHWGYWSCAPTTAIMALAYYNMVPPRDVTCSYPSAHTSHYGSYVADLYRFDEVFYNDTAIDNAGTPAFGGYGYMWNGSNGPYNKMSPYIQNHGVTAGLSGSSVYATVVNEINNNFPFSICSLLTSGGHLTLAVGYVNNQYTLIFNDPYGNKNNGYMNYYGKNVYYDWPGYNNGYANLNGLGWTVKSESSQLVYNDTIIDDTYYNHGFYLYNQGLAKMWYYRDMKTGGYNDHFWYTYTSAATTLDTCYVTWSPVLSSNNNYEVFAYIPNSAQVTATAAPYRIYYSGGDSTVVINQAAQKGQWVSLGIFPFSPSNQAFVRLGDGTGIAGQKIAYDAVKWVRTGQIDNIAPTTVANLSGNWQTQNFIATFTDTDNTGGTGIEKRFYQVLDYDGAEWHANTQNGFFADNFDSYNSGVWNIPAGSGTWMVSGGNLVQTDTTVNNGNIYAYLNQMLSNRYIYQFTVKLDAATSGTNPHRFGFHFFCDDGSLENRGNSYFIYFRKETSTLEFFKVVNNVFTQTGIINNVTTTFGQWYDIKVIYDRISGKTDVYRDNILLGTWTDPAPLTTNGHYISFRTGHSKVYISEIKVFRSRYPAVTVSVGDSAINDIRYQNPDPATYAAKIKSIVNDAAGNLSSIYYYNLNIDWTPPACVNVNDGPGADTDTTSSLTTLSANWSSSSDINSGISKYMYAIGTAPGSTDILGWTGNGMNTAVTKSGLSLSSGQTYFFSVQAVNGAELTSMCSSDGVLVNPVTNLKENDSELIASVFPNPFHENSTVYFNISGKQPIVISLTDMLGRTIVIANSVFAPGNHAFEINENLRIAKGAYVLKIESPDNCQMIRVTKF